MSVEIRTTWRGTDNSMHETFAREAPIGYSERPAPLGHKAIIGKKPDEQVRLFFARPSTEDYFKKAVLAWLG